MGCVIMIPIYPKSKNHICFNHGYEYLTGTEQKYVFKADPRDPIECTGNRERAEFLCTVELWNTTSIGKILPVVRGS